MKKVFLFLTLLSVASAYAQVEICEIIDLNFKDQDLYNPIRILTANGGYAGTIEGATISTTACGSIEDLSEKEAKVTISTFTKAVGSVAYTINKSRNLDEVCEGFGFGKFSKVAYGEPSKGGFASYVNCSHSLNGVCNYSVLPYFAQAMAVGIGRDQGFADRRAKRGRIDNLKAGRVRAGTLDYIICKKR